MDFSTWTPGAFFFFLQLFVKRAVDIIRMFGISAISLSQYKPDSGISSSHNVWNLRHCSRAGRCLCVTSFVYLLFDDWRQSSALSYYDQYPLNQYQVILKKQKGYLSQSEMEKYSDWIGWSCSGVGFGFCYATPIESGTFQCYERVLRGIMQHPGISDDYLSGL